MDTFFEVIMTLFVPAPGEVPAAYRARFLLSMIVIMAVIALAGAYGLIPLYPGFAKASALEHTNGIMLLDTRLIMRQVLIADHKAVCSAEAKNDGPGRDNALTSKQRDEDDWRRIFSDTNEVPLPDELTCSELLN